MGKVGGNCNFGFGKKMAWASKQALRESYGDGHHRSVAAHAERRAHFVGWARDCCAIRDGGSTWVVHCILGYWRSALLKP